MIWSTPCGWLAAGLVCLVAVWSGAPSWGAEVVEVPLANPSFEEGLAKNGWPVGWSRYGGGAEGLKVELVPHAHTGKQAVLIHDDDGSREVGLGQTVAAPGGYTYEASVYVRGVEDESAAGSYIQMRFMPSGRFGQRGLLPHSSAAFSCVRVRATAPADTRQVRLYLYTHRDPTPKVIVDSVKLVRGVEPPPPPPPEPVPPEYTKLKDLHLNTQLVKPGNPGTPAAAIVAAEPYADLAKGIQAAIEERSGVRVPIVDDAAPQAAVPIKMNLIALGNRSTNRTIEQLYNGFYTLLDLRYPGPEGYVVRTLHNPFGNGHNVVFVGGSDAAGVAKAAAALVAKLQRAEAAAGGLSIGRLAEIELGKDIEVPKDVRELRIWDASPGYRSRGYFGWNSISKHMAAYYMTGREHHAREFLRLAFPDKQALKEISEIDGERIENKDDPLAGTYHYNSHMMVLFWDLIEESPFFTDEQRLRVTNAFSRQLNHRKNEHIYGLTSPSRAVGSRHGQWSAVSIYCLGRYFQKDYPNPIWFHCVGGAAMHFASLHEYNWVGGENDNLFWYNTGIAPIFTYLVLSGDRKPIENGVAGKLLAGQEMLYAGRRGHWALRSASIGFLHKAAYLMQDGRYVYYQRESGIDTDVFRLGQSFWPEEHLAAKLPTDLVGKWSILALSAPHWAARRNGFKLEESFGFGSFRSQTGPGGDYILIDGFNGASRNPYHTFAILDLRLAGVTLLEGYRNQVQTRADGMVEPKVAMDAALKHHDVIGSTAICSAEVPNMPYCSWRRTLVQRVGKYALILDDLTFRVDSDNIEAQFLWERGMTVGRSLPAPGVLRLRAAGASGVPAGWTLVRARDQKCSTNLEGDRALVPLDSIGVMLLRAEQAGPWLDMPFTLDEPLEGEVFVELLNYKDRGVIRVSLDGGPLTAPHKHYSPGASPDRVPLGRRRLAAGPHRLRIETVATQPPLNRCYVGLVGLSVKPEAAGKAKRTTTYDVCLSDPVKTTSQGRVTTMEWAGPGRKGQHRYFFSLIARNAGDEAICARVDGHSAGLALPQPAVAIAGVEGDAGADLLILATDHLFATALRGDGRGSDFVKASEPVDVDWDFVGGTLNVVAAKPTVFRLRLAAAAALRVDGKASAARTDADGFHVLSLTPGRHTVENARPQEAALAKVRAWLEGEMLTEARSLRAKHEAAAAQKPAATAPAMDAAFTAAVGDYVVDLMTIPTDSGPILAAAEGKNIHLLDSAGKELRTLAVGGKIRMVRWWPEHKLLLAGCVNEEVVAFDLDGRRKWTFTSVMDPAVFRAAKTYWFKTAPGHEGIHGLHTGVFIDGKSQCFVGSACTLEIIDERGKLIKRMPLFWGKNSHFQIVDAPDGSLNLLAARRYSGVHHVSVVGNRDLKLKGRTFNGVPPGHTYVGGWSSMNRDHLFYVDLDGDGVKEVVSEINGTWNRVTVWSATGKALFDASFGPGERIMAKNMRDLDVADLDRDGKQEIVAATSSALVVALDCQCRKVWAKRLPSPVAVMKIMTPPGAAPWIVLGSDDGSVSVLDGQGALIRQDRVSGRPTCIAALDQSRVVLATTKGEVKVFQVGD